jgi:hypothetical protein
MEMRNTRWADYTQITGGRSILNGRREHGEWWPGVLCPPKRSVAAAPDCVSGEAGLEAAGRGAEAPEGPLLHVPPPALEKPRHLAGEVYCLVSHVLKLVPVLAGIPLSLARHV